MVRWEVEQFQFATDCVSISLNKESQIVFIWGNQIKTEAWISAILCQTTCCKFAVIFLRRNEQWTDWDIHSHSEELSATWREKEASGHPSEDSFAFKRRSLE